MTHLFICREYPPAAYWPGGIGTYVHHIASLLAQSGDTVHVISHRWDGAPRVREESHEGRLIVHRVALDEPVPGQSTFPLTTTDHSPFPTTTSDRVPRGMLASSFPSQAFSWQAALLAERLIDVEGIDVIEGQEWEAPLYYLQLRRALDPGHRRRPPCVVHLHSPTELIFEANGWDTTVADYRPAVAMEAYSIEAADALVCPSRYLADQALARYRIEPSRLSVIPYPLGDFPRIERRAEIWSSGSICYVGRLEPRKGVLEWAQAVASVAVEYPALAVDFVGGDMPLAATGGSTVRDAIRAGLPRQMRRRFRFHGSQDRARICQVLSRACAAVVPSRWENLPYSCIESMSSGLPVIASPHGGMRELVADGVSGWIAAEATPEGLAGALRRALETPASLRERMGHAAAESVRRVCGNDAIVARHLEVKADLVRFHTLASARAAIRSVPPVAVMAADSAPPARPRTIPLGGMGLVVICQSHGMSLAPCLSSIRGQTTPPAAVCIVTDGGARDEDVTGAAEGWQVVPRAGRSPHDAAVAAAHDLAQSHPSLAGLAFVDSRVRFDPDCLSVCRGVLAHGDGVGLVSAWTLLAGSTDRVQIQPCPDVSYLWRDEEVAPFVAVRLDAFEDALDRLEDVDSPSLRSIFDRLVTSGWTAITFPAVLGTVDLGPADEAARRPAHRYSSIARAVRRIHTPLLRWLLDGSPEERRELLRQAFRNPARSAQWFAARARPASGSSSLTGGIPQRPRL